MQDLFDHDLWQNKQRDISGCLYPDMLCFHRKWTTWTHLIPECRTLECILRTACENVIRASEREQELRKQNREVQRSVSKGSGTARRHAKSWWERKDERWQHSTSIFRESNESSGDDRSRWRLSMPLPHNIEDLDVSLCYQFDFDKHAKEIARAFVDLYL